MTPKLSQTALKFLSIADSAYQGKSLGTHAYNLRSYFGPLHDAGLITTDSYPFVHLTDAGRAALRPYYAAGGLPGGKRRKAPVAAAKVG
jgi:hypothetical protein